MNQLIFFDKPLPPLDALRERVNQFYHADETECINTLLDYLNFNETIEKKIANTARQLIETVRKDNSEKTGIEALMTHYDLSTEEGILLMCLAEALLRIPDKETEALLIKDKLTSAHWEKHIGSSESSFVNVATWGLALSGKILRNKPPSGYFKTIWNNLLQRASEPVIRRAVQEAMKILSEHFVLGRNINEALKKSRTESTFRYSYDMLGEVARTQKDADRYYQSYFNAVTTIGKSNHIKDVTQGPSISVKLSALHPRYQLSHREIVLPALTEKMKALVAEAKRYNVGLTIDAEEADRLDLSLDLFEALFIDPDFQAWEGLGLALQSYQKRAFYLLDWLIALARKQKKRIQLRLVKGAYWDSEIKLAQVGGFQDYPVFTRKINTDISYLACAQKIIAAQEAIFPQFATHNAYSVAAVLNLMGERLHEYQFEFQSLQGMGQSLHEQIATKQGYHIPSRIYAPVGSHKDLLPYLVRRLLENGANSSFVNRLTDLKIPIENLIESPVKKIKTLLSIPNHYIPLPKAIYGVARQNSLGQDLSDLKTLTVLSKEIKESSQKLWVASPFLRPFQEGLAIRDPANRACLVGKVEMAREIDVDTAIQKAQHAFSLWRDFTVAERAQILRNMATLVEKHYSDFLYLAIREAGKTLADAVAEVREAVDFCRYYAAQAQTTLMDQPLTGYTGETDVLRMQGRGIILCISPWNFPLAIFLGQVSAALVAGNVVIAKPAEQTPLIAALAVKLFHEAGIPVAALQLLPGKGETIGSALVKHPAIAGIIFTGSNETASAISKTIAHREGPIIPLIAETGGINAMIADSSALPEQLVRDVLISAFGSAGQRCSALRVLLIQEEIADRVIEMLWGAMAELQVGDPLLLATDIGPVIDQDALSMLQENAAFLAKNAKLIYEVKLDPSLKNGTFFAPRAFEISDLSLVKREVFGPILPVIRYQMKDLPKIIEQINTLGYGLTFGIHSRINDTIHYIANRIEAGNIYVNRTMIGAVVGVQPFGGSRLSGTGPKAGGPHYLPRLCTEVTITVDTTAAGGNASLMALID